MLRRPITIMALALMTMVPAAKGETYGSGAVQGIGATACSTWLVETPQVVRLFATVQWMLGVVTAYNRLVHNGGNVLEGLDTDQLLKRVEGFCRENPTALLADATEQVIIELRQ